MNYELAKKLKDAGFPQHDGDIDPHYHDTHQEGCTIGACSPTLSELIEACGEAFRELIKNSGESDSWMATGGPYVHVYGSSPEYAVAKLWLTLNTKV